MDTSTDLSGHHGATEHKGETVEVVKYQAKTLERGTIAGDSPGGNLISDAHNQSLAIMGESYP